MTHTKQTHTLMVESKAQTGTYSGILSKPKLERWLTVSPSVKSAPQKNLGVMRSQKENLRNKKKSTLMIFYAKN